MPILYHMLRFFQESRARSLHFIRAQLRKTALFEAGITRFSREIRKITSYPR